MKKFLSVFLVMFSILAMSTCYGAYSDISNSEYADAIEYLSNLDIISGYEDGTYKPDKAITRAEMAKLLVETSGVDIKNIDGSKSIFKDVLTSHWAIKYINVAASQGLIKGDGNGTFRPDDTINYAETVTMVIRMSGYDVNVEGLGNWPDNYIGKAKELNLFNDMTAEQSDSLANRGAVAQILYNNVKQVNTNPEYPIIKAYDKLMLLVNNAMDGNLSVLDKYGHDISMKTIIDANINIQGDIFEGDSEIELLKGIINDSKLEVVTNSSINNKFIQFIATWLVDNEKMLEGELNISNDKIYVKVKDIFDKYLIEQSDSSIFDELLSNTEPLTDDKKIYINETLKSIYNVISQKNVTTSNETIDIGNIKENVKKTVITIDEVDIMKMNLDLYERMVNNEQLIRAYYGNIYNIVENEDETDYWSRNVTINQLKEDMKRQIDSLKENIQKGGSEYYKKEYTITIYSKGELCNIIGMDFEYKDTDSYENSADNVVNIIARASKDRFIISFSKNQYYDEALIELTINLDTEILDQKVVIPSFNSTIEELDEETQKKLENKIIEIIKKMGYGRQYEEVLKQQNEQLEYAKKAVFFNDISTVQEAVTLARFNNISNEVNDWDGISSYDTVVVNGVVCNKFLSNASEKLYLSYKNIDDYAVDKQSGMVYYINGVIIQEEDGIYTYYNRITYVKGAQNGAIELKEYK